MSAFDLVTEGLEFAPLKTLTLTREHFASTYQNTPPNPIQIGLRLLSYEDRDAILAIGSEAASRARTQAESEIALGRATLIAAVARGICHQRDIRTGHDFFSCPDDLIPLALREDTVKWIFDELEKLQIETSPIYPGATNEEIAELSEVLADGVALADLEELSPARAARVRRYLDFVASELL